MVAPIWAEGSSGAASFAASAPALAVDPGAFVAGGGGAAPSWGSAPSRAGSGLICGSCSSVDIPIRTDFSTSASRSATRANGVGLGGGEVEVAGTSRPPTAVHTRGTMLAVSEVETFEPATPLAEAWPCCLSAFRSASRGHRTELSCRTTKKQHKKTLLSSAS
jgi:hypothetical protein